MIDKELLDILACPVCKEPVELTKDGKGLKCVKCGRVYPIRDDIPIMLEEEAYYEEDKKDSSDKT
ncbi:MAG: Trm112 family protein [Candidatus Aminicenantes bacterium]|nr:Trm112 family protein [Candidatus Aminicenantes bacterium]